MNAREKNERDVIVVGGGMVGAVCAAILARYRLSITLVEPRLPKPLLAGDEIDLRVSALSRASERILKKIGAWPLMESVRVSPYREMKVWDAAGAGIEQGAVHFDAADLGEPMLGHIVENRLIQQAVWQRLKQEPDVALAAPAEMRDARIERERAVVTLADGREISARLLVAADGAESPLRQRFGIDVSAAQYHQQGIVAVMRTEKPHRETAYQCFLPTGPLAYLPLADGRISIVWSCKDEEAARLLALSDEEFRRELSNASEHVLGDVIECSPRAAFPLRRQHAEHYVESRFALIGDAAHVVHPLAGQGANLGFLDAAALAETIAQAAKEGRDIGSKQVLRRYERWRRGDNLATLWAMEGFHRLFANDNSLLAGVRNAGFRVFERSGPIKREAMRKAMGLDGDLPEMARG